MMSFHNGVYIVQGEMMLTVVAMRRTSRWTSHTHIDDENDPLLRNFSDLRETLNHISDLSELDANIYLSPFLEVIRSDDTTGPVTGLALSSVNKFLSYGLIDPNSSSASTAVENITDAVIHARFVGTDPGSDVVVLMKILQVLRTLVLTPVGVLLTNESICEIMQSCFRTCFEMRLSELLRKSAEHALMDMVQLLFARLPTLANDSKWNTHFKKLKMRAGTVDSNRNKQRKRSPRPKHKKITPSASSQCLEDLNEDATATNTTSTTLNQQSSNNISPDSGLSSPQDCSEASAILEEKFREESPLESSAELTIVTATQPQISDNTEMIVEKEIEFSTRSSENYVDVGLGLNCSIPDCIEGEQKGDEEVAVRDVEENEENKVVDLNSQLRSSLCESTDDLESLPSVVDTDFINSQGVRFIQKQQLKEDSAGTLIPYGLPCVRELFRFLVSLINPLDKSNTDVMIHIGLSLLTVALETGADHINNFKSLLSLVKDDLCRNLFALIGSERISVLAATLRVCFLLFESLRGHLKFQLEMYLTKMMDIIASESSRISYDQREMVLDALVQMWRIPGLVTELYLNYDCDLYCHNLFEDLTKLLSKNAFPVTGLYSTHLLSLDALLTVVDSIETHCHSRILNERQNREKVQTGISAISGTNDKEVIDPNLAVMPEMPVVLGVSGYMLASHLMNKDKSSPNSASLPTITLSGARETNKSYDNIPNHEQIMAIKHKKKLIASGTEQFNLKPCKGIQFLQQHNLLSAELDPKEIVKFLKENPKLDKKKIGEYVSNRKNSGVLEAFVKSFNFEETRVDEALRMYLESFRLPGEAPVIAMLLEHFADHWHKSNGEPFADSDAAFTLAYAIIMLNVDQHNHNVKKQNNPMTLEDFRKNLSKVNGKEDFDQDMLAEMYNAIRNEEIVMPAEHTGLVKENYFWKVLLRRGATKDGNFIHAPNGMFDHDLFSLIWGPTVAALSFVFDKSSDEAIIQRAVSGFRKCAMISAHYGMSDVFDNLVITLCKFTTLLSAAETPENLPIVFGCNAKSQLAARTVFNLAHRHGDILREGWQNLLDCLLQLLKAKLLPKELVEAEDFIEASGQISLIRAEIPSQRADSGLFSSFYSYIAAMSESQSQRGPTPEELEAQERAELCIRECHPEQLVTESKFLQMDSLQELIKGVILASHAPDTHISLGNSYDEDATVFFLELLIKIVLQNRDRVSSIWQGIRDHIYSLVMGASASEHNFLMERAVVGILRLAIRLLRREDMTAQVLQSLRMLLLLKPQTLFKVSRQISCALYELLKTTAANIHSIQDWSTLFTLLECVGAGARPPRILNGTLLEPVDAGQVDSGVQSDSEISTGHTGQDSSGQDRGYTSDSELSYGTAIRQSPHHAVHPEASNSSSGSGGWILVGKEGEIEALQVQSLPVDQYNIMLQRELLGHDMWAFVKCCESLVFLVRDVAHITPENFESCVHCIRTFVEASLNGGRSNSGGGGDRRSSSSSMKHRDGNAKERSKTWKGSRRKDDGQTGKRSHRHASRTGSGSLAYMADDEDDSELPDTYHQVSIQLLDLMHTLHTRAASIYNAWAEEEAGRKAIAESESGLLEESSSASAGDLWTKCWCPLLQGIARLCCDCRRAVRTSAVTYLQRALLVHDLQTLTPVEWEACFNKVLFPLLAKLLENLSPSDPVGMEETRMRGATLLCKVFLQHLTPLLSLPTFTALWLTILDFMDKYMHVDKSDLLCEAIPESLKNMLLVMETAGIFQSPEGKSQLWTITWDRIDAFLPGLRDEVYKSQQPPPIPPEQKQKPNNPEGTMTEPTDNNGNNVPVAPPAPVDVEPAPTPSLFPSDVHPPPPASILFQPPLPSGPVVGIPMATTNITYATATIPILTASMPTFSTCALSPPSTTTAPAVPLVLHPRIIGESGLTQPPTSNVSPETKPMSTTIDMNIP